MFFSKEEVLLILISISQNINEKHKTKDKLKHIKQSAIDKMCKTMNIDTFNKLEIDNEIEKLEDLKLKVIQYFKDKI